MFHRNPAGAESYGRGLSFSRILTIAFSALTALPPIGATAQDEAEQKTAAKELRELGGRVFIDLKTGLPIEVNLNEITPLTDRQLSLVARLKSLTDFSAESTSLDNAGIAKLSGLKKLEWLNLYRTQVGDEALPVIAQFPQLIHLPIGETAVTDAGLPALKECKKLEYLGLRGNRISDRGVSHLLKIETLRGLHLGQTTVTDDSLKKLMTLPNLNELWLHDTAISDTGIRELAKVPKPKKLAKLHLQRTSTTAGAISDLRQAWPDCEILWESDP